MTIKRVLFVDDEKNVLDGLRRSLRQMRHEWEMDFVESPSEALSAFARQPFDVVITDMRMPELDGSELLKRLMQEYPACIRIILSGHSDPAAIMKSVGVTHQYLAKPCDSDALKKSVDRALSLRSLIGSDSVRGAVSGARDIPAAPEVYSRLVACLRSETTSTADVADIISHDVGLTSRLLQLVNSAFFGLPRAVSDVAQAVVYLGLDTIGSLVLMYGAFKAYDAKDLAGLDVDELMRYSLRSAQIARALAAAEGWSKDHTDQAFLAAMLQDIGKLVLAAEMPQQFSDYALRRPESPVDVEQLEQDTFGATHAQVGAYLVGLWGLPDPIVEAIAYHEAPSGCIDPDFGVFGLVHVASRLALGFDVDEITDPRLEIDSRYLARAGALNRWPSWREIVRSTREDEASAA